MSTITLDSRYWEKVQDVLRALETAKEMRDSAHDLDFMGYAFDSLATLNEWIRNNAKSNHDYREDVHLHRQVRDLRGGDEHGPRGSRGGEGAGHDVSPHGFVLRNPLPQQPERRELEPEVGVD